jgi:hypothetical protein
VGWTFQGIVTYGLPYTPSFYYESNPHKRVFHRLFYGLFQLMPWNPLAKAILDMAAATNTPVHPGLSWGERYGYCMNVPEGGAAPAYDPFTTWKDLDCIFPVGSCLAVLAAQFFVYTGLAIWLDAIMPNALGVNRHPLFFLHRAFWRPRPAEQGEALAQLLAEGEARAAAEKRIAALDPRASVAGGPDEDEDVGEESARIKHSLSQRLGSLVRVEESAWLGGADAKGKPAATPVVNVTVGVSRAAALRRSSQGGLRRRSSAGGNSTGGGAPPPPVVHAQPAAEAGQWPKSHKPSDSPDYAVEVFGLRKVFPRTWWARTMPAWLGGRPKARDFVAIKDSWFGIEQGKLFCLLGPNGAGKTTTINCLTGARRRGPTALAGSTFAAAVTPPAAALALSPPPLADSDPCPSIPQPTAAAAPAGALPPTAGDALVYGESLRGEGGLDRVRSLMGVCPQFDVLWGELSGREHLIIYGHIKGLKPSKVRRAAARLGGKAHLPRRAGLRGGRGAAGAGWAHRAGAFVPAPRPTHAPFNRGCLASTRRWRSTPPTCWRRSS